ncbi:MAG: hypothetical protein J0H20_17665 [Rhizobiales bacterium]|nr:hypothetical protein [Hyphomicrobiales bacterium]
MDLTSFARRLPKIELHLHLEGAVRPSTFVELARKNGVELPDFDEIGELYRYDNLPDFLKIYDLVSRSIRDANDFHRITYEMLESCAASNARHVEFFFSAHAHQAHGVDYLTMLDGILAAMADIETDKGLTSRLIPAHSRELGLQSGLEFLDMGSALCSSRRSRPGCTSPRMPAKAAPPPTSGIRWKFSASSGSTTAITSSTIPPSSRNAARPAPSSPAARARPRQRRSGATCRRRTTPSAACSTPD